MNLKPNFDIWWHRVIVTFLIALVLSVGLFFMKEKPFSEESKLRYQEINEGGGHYDPPGTVDDHHDSDEADEEADHEEEPGASDDHHDDDAVETTFPAGPNMIYVPSQSSGAITIVGLVTLEEAGYVVIHESTSGVPDAIVGNSELLSAGESSDIRIALNGSYVDGTELIAMLHSDNGDGVFSPADDSPVTDGSGNVIYMRYQISDGDEEDGEAADEGLIRLIE